MSENVISVRVLRAFGRHRNFESFKELIKITTPRRKLIVVCTVAVVGELIHDAKSQTEPFGNDLGHELARRTPSFMKVSALKQQAKSCQLFDRNHRQTSII